MDKQQHDLVGKTVNIVDCGEVVRTGVVRKVETSGDFTWVELEGDEVEVYDISRVYVVE